MKKKFVLSAILLLFASAVVARDTYSYSFSYYDGYKVTFDSSPGSTSDLDSNDVGWGSHAFLPSEYGLTIYKEKGKYGWNGDSGFYISDRRAPLIACQTEVYEDIYLWAGKEVSLPRFEVYSSNYMSPAGMTYSLDLISVPSGVTYTGKTHWTQNDKSIILPFITTEDPRNGYRFRATVTAPVPEPSSILGLLVGLASAGGILLRKRS